MDASDVSNTAIDALAQTLMLGPLLEMLRERHGRYQLLEHWTQGEFHHDLVLKVGGAPELPGSVLVVATNCNGGVKEVLCFDEPPPRAALWHYRCPNNPEFQGELPPVLARATTPHWFDPAELLGEHARSELRPEYRQRQPGGGWIKRAG